MRTPVLLAAGAALWEADAVRAWEHPRSEVALLKRCMDLSDLLSTATTGVARVAVIDAAVFGLDADALRTLRELDVRSVVVSADDVERFLRIGADAVVAPYDVRDVLAALASHEPEAPAIPEPTLAGRGRLVAVWGPAGAPGRTTVAIGLAHSLSNALLIDADPYGGVVGQSLGVLDPVSGLLAATRAANLGRLDAMALAGACVRVNDLRVLTGLPRADRWAEVRVLDQIVDRARELAPWIVLDAGFSLERDADAMPGAPQRNDLTVQALEAADDVVVVGAPDAIGLARLVRGLAELHDLLPTVCPLVVVNRARPSVGWSVREVVNAVAQVAPASDVLFLPDDPAGADRALVAGRPMSHAAGAPYRKAFAGVAQALSRRYSPVTV